MRTICQEVWTSHSDIHPKSADGIHSTESAPLSEGHFDDSRLCDLPKCKRGRYAVDRYRQGRFVQGEETGEDHAYRVSILSDTPCTTYQWRAVAVQQAVGYPYQL